jgi:hypothetical protein
MKMTFYYILAISLLITAIKIVTILDPNYWSQS